MSSRIVIGFVAAAALTGCLPPIAATPPRPLKPMDGPRASVYVDYFGGMYTRQIQTRFRVERGAYVVVGHLGGDGEIRILYPETPRATGWVAGGRTVSLKPRAAIYDMSPHLYSFASAPYRTLSSAYDSYDGLGHGYVFIIASRSPIDHQALAMGKGYESVTVNDYDTSSDLRYAVRQFADEITIGPYTLQYAKNPGSSLYAQMTGCPSSWGLFSYRQSAFGMMDFISASFFPYPGSSLMSAFAFARNGMGRYCRGTYYAGYADRNYGYRTSTVYVPVAPAPRMPITPELQRPTRRTIQDPERRPLLSGHSSIERGTTRTRTSESTPWRPSVNRPNYPGSSSGYTERARSSSQSSGSGEIYRPTRPTDTPRMTTPLPPPTTITTTSSSSEGGTRAARPNPRP
jgi:hypothetical protein